MTNKTISANQFKSYIKDGGSKTDVVVIKDAYGLTVDSDARTITFVASTNTLDRQEDVIDQSGWLLDNFNKNPVILWNHESDKPPIGKARAPVVQGNKLLITVDFLPASNPWNGNQAEGVFQMLCTGYLAAVSVGFKVIDFEFPDDPDQTGVIFTKMELLELSVCPIPCNPEALLIPSSLPEQSTPEVPQPEIITTSVNDETIRAKRLMRIRASL